MDATKKRGKGLKSYYPELLQDWDLVPSRSILKLFHANTRLKEAQRDFVVKQIETQKEKMYTLCGWQEVQANNRELRREFQKSNKTICEHRAAIDRVNQKTKELLSAQTSVQDEIDHIKLEIEKYSETRETMGNYVTTYSTIFTSFLEHVAEKGQGFNSVQDILNEYEKLCNCKNECAVMLKKEMDEASELRRDMMKLVEEKSSRLKTLNNALVLLGVRQKTAVESRKKWNQVVINLEEITAKRLEESVTLQDGCTDLYREVCNKRKTKPTITKEDTKNQMQYITNSILFYKDVIHLGAALQQYQKQNTQRENSECKSNFVKKILKDILKQSISNMTHP